MSIDQLNQNLDLDEQSNLVVKVFKVSLDTLKEAGLEETEALNGLLSQIAVLVEPEALNHAIELNKLFRDEYLQTNSPSAS